MHGMGLAVRRGTVAAVAALLVSAVFVLILHGGDASPAASDDDPASWGVELTVPADAFGEDVDVVLSGGDGGGDALLNSAARSRPFSIDADGQQPAAPLQVSLPAADLEVDEPSHVYLARWDDEHDGWVPLPTRFDASDATFIAEVDHLSWFRFWEWQAWEDLGDGVRRTADEVAALFDRADDAARRFARQLEEGVAILAEGAGAWLGLGGADPPLCTNEDTGFELSEPEGWPDVPLHVCQEPGRSADHVTLRMANNRPYGMLVVRPSSSTIELDAWPSLAVDSGEAAVFSFFAMVDATFSTGQSYLPPGATVRLDLKVAELDQVRIEASSTPAVTGFDLAMKLAWALWLEAPQVGVEGVNCLIGLDSTRTLFEDPAAGETPDAVGVLEAVRTCLRELGYELGGSVYDVFRATASTIPSLLVNLADTDYRRFEVHNVVELTRREPTADLVDPGPRPSDSPPEPGCVTVRFGYVGPDVGGSDDLRLVLLSRDPDAGSGYARPSVADDVSVELPVGSATGQDGLELLQRWAEPELTLLWICGRPTGLERIVAAGDGAPDPSPPDDAADDSGGEAEDTTQAADDERFWLPSRNIACQYVELSERDTLRCDIMSGLDPEPDEPCNGGGGWFAIYLEDQEPAMPICPGDTVVYGDFADSGPVLEYGQTWERGELGCRAEETGLECWSELGHGFWLARSGWETY